MTGNARTDTTASGTVHHSSDFGWKPNQDVTEQFTRALTDGTLKAGDELFLDHSYRIDIMKEGCRRILPDNFTLSAARGAGFDVDGLTQEHDAPPPVLELGNRNTLRNLTIVCEGVPTKIFAPKRHAKFFRAVAVSARGKDDILIENCRLSGLIRHNIKVADCRRLNLIGCRIVGGYWSVYLVSVSDVTMRHSLFEKSTCDSIKTGSSPDGGICRNYVVENCVFQDNGIGDGIDTTGGFNDSVVRDCIFRRILVSGMDIKSHYFPESGSLEGVEPQNNNILIERCTFYDIPNAIILTTCSKPGVLTPENIEEYVVHDVDVNDCIVGYTKNSLMRAFEHYDGYGVTCHGRHYLSGEGEHMHAIYLKDAHSIRYRNLRLFGERTEEIMPAYVCSVVDSFPDDFTEEAAAVWKSFDHSITGNVIEEPAPPVEPGVTEVPFACGPQDMT